MADNLPFQMHVEEYKHLTDEIKRRVSYQILLLGGNITFVSVVIDKISERLDSAHLTALLVVPLVSLVIVWMFFEQDVFITQAASYIHRSLRQKIISSIEAGQAGQGGAHPPIPADILDWEGFRHNALFGTWANRAFMWAMAQFRLLATAGPGAFLLVGACLVISGLQGSFCSLSVLQRLLLAADVVAVAVSTALHFIVIGLYKRISA